MGIKKGDIQHLKTLRIASKQAQKGNIDKVISLYEERKMDNLRQQKILSKTCIQQDQMQV